MMMKLVTNGEWRLDAQEVVHALPVFRAASAWLRSSAAPHLDAVRDLAARHGVKDGAVRTALSRACAERSLVARGGDDGRRRYQAGPRTLERAATARALLDRAPGVSVAIIQEGRLPPGRLAALRSTLGAQGFRPLQRGVWLGARTARPRLMASPALLQLDCDSIPLETRLTLEERWGLSRRAEVLHDFHRALFKRLTQPRSWRERAWRCLECAPIWYRVTVLEEPPFPLPLLPDEYPMAGLQRAWRAHLRRERASITRLWKEVCA